jgi:hypothetical protein
MAHYAWITVVIGQVSWFYPKRIFSISLFSKTAAKYGYGQAWRDPATMRPSVVYKIGSLGYYSSGPHLDLKRVDRGTSKTTGAVQIKPNEIDSFAEVNVEGKWLPLSKGTTITDNEAGFIEEEQNPLMVFDYAAPCWYASEAEKWSTSCWFIQR